MAVFGQYLLWLALCSVISCRILQTVAMISSSLPTTNLDPVCTDGVCSLPTTDAFGTNKLSEKVLSDWKSASALTEDQESPVPETPSDSTVDTGTDDRKDGLIATTTGEKSTKNSDTTPPAEEAVKVFTDLGWSDEEARSALAACNGDMAEASAYLERQDEERDARNALLSNLTKDGWDQHAAYVAIEHCGGNGTAALEMLVQEDEDALKNFNIAVQDMVSHSSMGTLKELRLTAVTLNARWVMGGRSR